MHRFILLLCILAAMNISTTNQMPFPSQEITLNTREKTLKLLCPQDPEMVLNSITDEQYEKDKFLPYWAEHWPSAQVLFPFIEKSKTQLSTPNTRICELGCGLGIVSSLLAQFNHSVFSVDISPQACIYSKENISRNGGISRVIVSDWRAMAFKKEFDLVVASDVLYEQRWIDPVLNCIKGLLKPGGKAWIADPCRRFWEIFKQTAAQSGFTVKIIHNGTVNKTKVEIVELSKVLS